MFNSLFSSKRIYLDYASSTPVDRTMVSSFPRIPLSILMANPSALHREGVMLSEVLSDARTLVGRTIGAHSDEIIFTSNATESDNLALLGSVKHFLENGILPTEIGIYMSPFEHAAVSESIVSLDAEIFISTLSHEAGYVTMKNLVFPAGVKAVLISIMMVQNEVGITQDIKELAKQVRKLRKEYPDVQILFHTDATQAPLLYDLHVLRLGVDMMTLGATKLYCQKGVGMLYKKRTVVLSPVTYGGGQEFGLRPGTEPVALIHQFVHAVVYAQLHRDETVRKIAALQRYFEKKLKELFPGIRITGSGEQSHTRRAPHISHVVVPSIDSELLVIELDARGIAVSSKSACKNEGSEDSSVLTLFYPHETVGAIRVSYGRTTTKKHLDRTIEAIVSVLKKYRITL